jgi:hypothetical protein
MSIAGHITVFVSVASEPASTPLKYGTHTIFTAGWHYDGHLRRELYFVTTVKDLKPGENIFGIEDGKPEPGIQ